MCDHEGSSCHRTLQSTDIALRISIFYCCFFQQEFGNNSHLFLERRRKKVDFSKNNKTGLHDEKLLAKQKAKQVYIVYTIYKLNNGDPVLLQDLIYRRRSETFDSLLGGGPGSANGSTTTKPLILGAGLKNHGSGLGKQ